jgi:hypothetical protein
MAQERKLKAPTGAVLSKYLRALALDIETTNAEGDLVTKAQALAALVWKHALGFIERDPKTDVEVVHPPDWRAIDTIFNRVEGKVANAIVEDTGRSLTEKMTDLGRARINALAKASVEDPPEEAEDNGA